MRAIVILMILPLAGGFHLPFLPKKRGSLKQGLQLSSGLRLSSKDNSNGGDPNMIEKIMRQSKLVDSRYKFGDISKRTLAQTLSALDKDGDGVVSAGEVAEAAKETIEKAAKATRIVDEDYELGDITKMATDAVTKTAERSIQQITRNETYQFGDFTKKFLSEGDKALNKIREEAFNNIPKQVWTDMLGDLTEQQREAVAISLIQLAACAVLAFNLATNIVVSFTWIRAWKLVLAKTGLSPISTGVQWSKFIASRSSVETFVNPIALPLAAAATLFLLIPYKDFVEGLEKRMPLKRRFPVMNKLLTLFVATLTVNLGAVAGVTSGVLYVLNKVYL